MRIVFCKELNQAIVEIRNADYTQKPTGFVAVLRKDTYYNKIVTDYISEPYEAKDITEAKAKFKDGSIEKATINRFNSLIEARQRKSISQYKKYFKKNYPFPVTTIDELKEAMLKS